MASFQVFNLPSTAKQVLFNQPSNKMPPLQTQTHSATKEEKNKILTLYHFKLKQVLFISNILKIYS